MARTPLALYLERRLQERGETPEEFAERVGINPSGLYKLLRGAYKSPSQASLVKIARGLGMTAGELLSAVEAKDEDDPIERAIRQRTAEMREAVQGVPRPFWPAIIQKTFDRAIEGAKDMAQMAHVLADTGSLDDSPVSGHTTTPLSSPDRVTKRDVDGPSTGLPVRYIQRPQPRVLAVATLVGQL